MPRIYLSPSTQQYNEFVTGGTEEYFMNQIADGLEPLLRSNGIMFSRNTPDMTAASSIAASNAGSYALHLGLHSNASPAASYGQNRGSIVFHYPCSAQGAAAAGAIAGRLRQIYPLPQLVQVRATRDIGEVSKVRAVAAFVEVAYHDNVEDANWITANLTPIAEAIAAGVTDYFGLPFLPVVPLRSGVVDTSGSALNIRSLPSMNARILARAHDGARLTILNEWMGWYAVEFGAYRGFASAAYITLL